MDIRVQELLDKIKREGVESAQAEAAKILAKAEAEKEEILEAAKKEAKALLDRAGAEAIKAEESGKAALKQASRDLVLAFKGEVDKVLAAIVKQDADAAFNADTLKKALPGILEAWAKGSDELALLVPAKELAELEAFFKDKLAAKLKAGIEIKPFKDAKAGFRIVEKGGAAYYDFSAEAVADMLGSYLNTQLASIVAEAAR